MAEPFESNRSTGFPYESEEFVPREHRTTMPSPPKSVRVDCIEHEDHQSGEESNTHLYVPKGVPKSQEEEYTSLQPRFALVQVNDGSIRNMQTVLFNKEADVQMRRNALRQLKTNVKQRDCEESRSVLAQWDGLGITID